MIIILKMMYPFFHFKVWNFDIFLYHSPSPVLWQHRVNALAFLYFFCGILGSFSSLFLHPNTGFKVNPTTSMGVVCLAKCHLFAQAFVHFPKDSVDKNHGGTWWEKMRRSLPPSPQARKYHPGPDVSNFLQVWLKMVYLLRKCSRDTQNFILH